MNTGDITVVILAAGESSRLGRPKQLVLLNGIPLVAHATTTALTADLGPVVVVLGAHVDAVAPALIGFDVSIVTHRDWRLGMGSSIAVGVSEALRRADCSAVILMTCDQPGVTSEHLRRLAALWRETKAESVASTYGNTRGIPALFAQSLQAALASIAPSEGARSLLRGSPSVPCPGCEADIDVLADLPVPDARTPQF